MEAWAFTLFVLGVLLLLNLFTKYRLKELVMTLADDLRNIEVQLGKAKAEVSGKIEALESALATSGEQPQEVTDAVEALKAISQSLDDVVPDDVPAEPAKEVEAEEVEEVDPVETPAAGALVEALEAAKDENSV